MKGIKDKILFIIPSDILILTILLYIYSGIILFLVGWCKWYIGGTISVLSLYIVFKISRDYLTRDFVAVKLSTVSLMIALGGAIYIMGYGRFTNQTPDWQKHNAIINDLVNYSWPVVYDNGYGYKCMLTYYVGQYLVPGLFGKLFGSYRIAEIVNALWAYTGIVLVYINLLRLFKCENPFKQLLVLIVLLFFCYPYVLGRLLIFLIYGNFFDGGGEWVWSDSHIKLQYNSNWILLSWVFPQVIVAWLSSTLFWDHYNKIKYYIPMLLPALLYGSLSFIGFIPYIIVWPLIRFFKDKGGLGIVKEVFSGYNIIMSLSLGVVILTYLLGNVLGDKPKELSFQMIDYHNKKLLYLIFVLCTVVPYLLLVYKKNVNNWLFYVTFVSLCTFPLFTMGLFNDFTMRCSIPALFFLMLFVLQYICYGDNCRLFARKRVVFILILLLFSMKYIARFIVSNIWHDNIFELADNKSFGTMRYVVDKKSTVNRLDYKYNYFAYDIEETVFYRYIARK